MLEPSAQQKVMAALEWYWKDGRTTTLEHEHQGKVVHVHIGSAIQFESLVTVAANLRRTVRLTKHGSWTWEPSETLTIEW